LPEGASLARVPEEAAEDQPRVSLANTEYVLMTKELTAGGNSFTI